MQRERGKVITQTNKEMIAKGSSEIKAQSTWKVHLNDGKPKTLLTEKILHKRATVDKTGDNDKKPINKPKEKLKDHDQPTHDH
jgi:hypothetical protein